jgi:hypothetical protein
MDDAEKRIAGLEPQLAELNEVAEPGRQQAQPVVSPDPSASPQWVAPSGLRPLSSFSTVSERRVEPPSRLWRVVKWPIAIAVLAVSLVFLGLGAHDYLGYLAGAPATATIRECDGRLVAIPGSRPATQATEWICTVTWSVGGQSYAGSVADFRLHTEGSTMDVRVHGGKAYTKFSGVDHLLYAFALLLVAAMVGCSDWVRRKAPPWFRWWWDGPNYN